MDKGVVVTELPLLGGAYLEGDFVKIPHKCGAAGVIKMTLQQYEKYFFLAILDNSSEKYTPYNVNALV